MPGRQWNACWSLDYDDQIIVCYYRQNVHARMNFPVLGSREECAQSAEPEAHRALEQFLLSDV